MGMVEGGIKTAILGFAKLKKNDAVWLIRIKNTM